MDPPLPTDADANLLFDQASAVLQDRFGHTADVAAALAREYYTKFTDAKYCASIKIPRQDDDFFHHEGRGGLAKRIHYYIALQGEPSPEAYIDWRRDLTPARTRKK